MKKVFPGIAFVFASILLVCQTGLGSQLRIVSLVPSQTELLFAMFFNESVVGVSDFCNFPVEVASLPHVGGVDLNLEKLISLRPTVIVDLNSMHRRYELFFIQAGLLYRDYKIQKLCDIPIVAARLASDLGSPERGKTFIEFWEREISLIQGFSGKRLKIYVEIWDTPLQGAGPSSFIGELVERAGAINVLASAGVEYPVVNSEEIIRSNPEAIILAYPVGSVENVKTRLGWSEVDAVRRNRIKPVDFDIFVRPGPRTIQALKTLSEIFSDSLEK